MRWCCSESNVLLPPPPKPTPLPPPPVEQPPPPEPKPEPPTPVPTPAVLPERVPEPPPAPTPAPTVPEPVQKVAPEIVTSPVVVPPSPYLNVTQPSYANRVEPDYPTQARRLHQQGTVTLALYINALGSLDKIEVVKSSGFRLLDDAAVEAMKQSRFHPAYQGNTPTPSRAEVSVNFVLESG